MTSMMSPEQRREADKVVDLLRSMDPKAAAQSAGRLAAAAGLSANVAGTIMDMADQRERAERTADREWTEYQQRREIETAALLESVRAVRQAQFRQQILDQQIMALLQTQIDDVRRMTDKQAADRFRSIIQDDRLWPAARESLREAMLARTSDAFFEREQKRMRECGDVDAALTLDGLQAALSRDTIKTILREELGVQKPQAASDPSAPETPRQAVERRLMASLYEATANLAPEKRAECEAALRAGIAEYLEQNGLDVGASLSETDLAKHTEGLRGKVMSSLCDLYRPDGNGLTDDEYIRMVKSVDRAIDGLATVPAQDREAAIRTMLNEHEAKCRAAGLDPDAVSMEAIMADAARGLHERAAEIMKDPSRASAADQEFLKAMGEAAKRDAGLSSDRAAALSAGASTTETPKPTVVGVLGRLHARRASDAKSDSEHDYDGAMPR